MSKTTVGALFKVINGISSSNCDSSIVKDEEFDLLFIRPSKTALGTFNGFVRSCDIPSNKIFPADTLFVSTNGEGSHTYSYVCPIRFTANADVAALIPRVPMTLKQKIYYSYIITYNRPRYSYGRKPKGDRLKNLDIPDLDEIPDYVETATISNIKSSIHKTRESFDVTKWGVFKVEDIFKKVRVKKYSKIPDSDGDIPFISSSSLNNGIASYVDVDPIEGNCITVSTNGECFDCFYQDRPIAVSNDVEVLYNEKMNKYSAAFLCAVLRLEKPKWAYGRKPKNNKVFETLIRLPIDEDGNPDFNAMENYIRKLVFSDKM
ncbi:MAG: restriction endonuclease subunit S [Bacilli bacterium]|nr:restriction endonuclease subunit S [Bacilli bacterium]